MRMRRIYSPYDHARDHGSPCDAAAVGPLGLLSLLPAAEAQAAHVNGQHQQTQAQSHRCHAGQEDKRLEEEEKRDNFQTYG